MKNVHSDAVDYLEVLAHKAQLFHVKSTLQAPGGQNNPAGGSDNYRPVLAFPELTWCVQDWSLEWTARYPDASSYIHGMVDGSRRVDSMDDADIKDSGLSSLFPHINGHVLHPPTERTRDLARLPSLTYKELDELYMQDIEVLRQLVFESLIRDTLVREEAERILRIEAPRTFPNGSSIPDIKDTSEVVVVSNGDNKHVSAVTKVSPDITQAAKELVSSKNSMLYGQRSRTGPEIARLLRILVDAANNGAMPTLPSSWSALANQAATAAKDAAINQFNFHKRLLIRDDNPYPSTEFATLLNQENENALSVFDHLVTGLRGSIVRTKRMELVKLFLGDMESAQAENRARIETYTRRQGDSFKRLFDVYIDTLTIPQPSTVLKQLLKTKKEELLEDYKLKIITRYKDDAKTGISSVDHDMDKISATFIGKNNEALKDILMKAEGEAVKAFTDKCNAELETETNKEPHTTQKMESTKGLCIQAGNDAFDDKGRIAKDETTYNTHKNSAQQRMSSKWQQYIEENNNHLQRVIVFETSTITDKLKKDHRDARHNSIPADTDTAKLIKTTLENNARSRYDNMFTSYLDNPIVASTWSVNIYPIIKDLNEKFDKENLRAWVDIFQEPLDFAMKDVQREFTADFQLFEDTILEYARSRGIFYINQARQKALAGIQNNPQDAETNNYHSTIKDSLIKQMIQNWIETDTSLRRILNKAWIRKENEMSIYLGGIMGILLMVLLFSSRK